MARKCPDSVVLRDAFRIEVRRRSRRADGTLSLGGTRFEIPARLRHLSEVHVRYARWDFSRVDLVDPRTGAILCSIKPLDKAEGFFGEIGLSSCHLPPRARPPMRCPCSERCTAG